MKLYIEPFKKIMTNRLLDSVGLQVDFVFAKQLKQILSQGKNELSKSHHNIVKIADDVLEKVYTKYGQEGLFDLLYLAQFSGNQFEWYYKIVKDSIQYIEVFDAYEELRLDNSITELNIVDKQFNTNLFFPSLSRKIYHMGTPLGAGIVYGLGRPRILVSLPFIGISAKTETYPVYENSLNIYTSLMTRGYCGSFMFMDFLPGLNEHINNIPLWLVWFSFVANNSDLVIFIEDSEYSFTHSQKLEKQYIPNHVPQKTILIPHAELNWEKSENDDKDVEGIVYAGENGEITQNEWYEMERNKVREWCELYANNNLIKDRYLVLSEDGKITEYPLNFNIYTYDEKSNNI